MKAVLEMLVAALLVAGIIYMIAHGCLQPPKPTQRTFGTPDVLLASAQPIAWSWEGCYIALDAQLGSMTERDFVCVV
jgi:hypothetical protein